MNNATDDTLSLMERALWEGLPQKVASFLEQARPMVESYVKAKDNLPNFLWYNPLTKMAVLRIGQSSRGLQRITGVKDILLIDGDIPPGFGKEAWMPMSRNLSLRAGNTRELYSTATKIAEEGGALRPLFQAVNLAPNPVNHFLGGPTPIAASLAGSLLGAGIGYGGGWLGEKLMGEDVLKPGRLRRTAAIAGGLLGAVPGAYLGSVGMRVNAQNGQNPWRAWIEPEKIFGAGPEAHVPPMEVTASLREMDEDLTGVLEGYEPSEEFKKAADDAGGSYLPMIPVDAFNRTIWEDPYTPVGVRAATTGLIESASQSRGGAQFISPFDVSRIAVGMGSGLISGMLVGKVLGALAGLTPDAQRTLKQTGMWAGALANVVPQAFGF